VANAKKTNMIASGNSTAAAAFTTGWLPNAGTLQLASTKQYVTADSSGMASSTDIYSFLICVAGNFTLAAIRSVAQAWEQYVIRPKVGAPAGVSSMKAVSNGLYITLGSDGSLINNGTTESASVGLKFIAT
jgi:endo-1,3(4)-beta-glucanase